MKKLITLSLAVMLVSLAQAATFNWGTNASMNSQNPDVDDEGYTSPNVTFQLVYFGAVEPTLGNGNWDIVLNDLVGVAGTKLDWASGSYAYNAGTASFSYDAPQGTIDGWYGVVILDDATPGYYGFDYFQISGLQDTDAPELINLGSTNAGQFETVPEPTSVALLAIGVAALGLRRRRA